MCSVLPVVCIAWHCMAIHGNTWHCVTLHCITVHHIHGYSIIYICTKIYTALLINPLRMHVYIYIYTYVYIYVFTYNLQMYIYISMYKYLCIYVCIDIRTYMLPPWRPSSTWNFDNSRNSVEEVSELLEFRNSTTRCLTLWHFRTILGLGNASNLRHLEFLHLNFWNSKTQKTAFRRFWSFCEFLKCLDFFASQNQSPNCLLSLTPAYSRIAVRGL